MRAIVVLTAAVLVLAGCGTESPPAARDQPTPTPTPTPTPAAGLVKPSQVPAAAGEVVGIGTVLDDGDGAEFCLGGVAQSLPPQCGGPAIHGWDWDAVKGRYDEASGVRFGEFVLVGTFDGETFTLATVADDPSAPEPDPDPDLTTRCAEPEGGWVIDRERTGERHQQRTFRTAKRMPGYAGAWVDEATPHGRTSDEFIRDAERGIAPTEPPIINVQVTGDPGEAEAELRAVWGGGLCVTTAEHTEAELGEIQQAMTGLPGLTYAGSGFDRVDVGVIHDDGSIQAWADATYGAGLVRVWSALRAAD